MSWREKVQRRWFGGPDVAVLNVTEDGERTWSSFGGPGRRLVDQAWQAVSLLAVRAEV